MARKISQCEKILQFIQDTGSITPLDALKHFGCMRLASRMCDIKRMGYPVVKEMEISKNRYGEPIRYARYYLSGGE